MTKDFAKLDLNEKRHHIIGTIENTISNFFYADRKEDDVLTVGDIEHAVTDGVISLDEIIEEFTKHIEYHLS